MKYKVLRDAGWPVEPVDAFSIPKDAKFYDFGETFESTELACAAGVESGYLEPMDAPISTATQKPRPAVKNEPET